MNAVNEKLGMTENFWEHRSFKEQGLDIEPQIHLGEKASALERAGIPTARGDINREIIRRNTAITVAKATLKRAEISLSFAKTVAVRTITHVTNEIVDMIREMARHNQDRLSLPIVSGKYLRYLSNRQKLQSREVMEAFVHDKNLVSFDDMAKFKESNEKIYKDLVPKRNEINERMQYLEGLLEIFEKYKPYIKYHKEQWSLKGRERKKYEQMHGLELSTYDVFREALKSKIKEPDKKITAKAWREELDVLTKQLEATKEPFNESVINLAKVEVLEHNKKNLERLISNERRARETYEQTQEKGQNRNNQLL